MSSFLLLSSVVENLGECILTHFPQFDEWCFLGYVGQDQTAFFTMTWRLWAQYLVAANFLFGDFFFFLLSPLMHVGKLLSGFGKKSCVCTGVESQETHRC